MAHDVLLLEPWYRGSHRQWADGWRAASRHRIHIVGSPETAWRRGLTTNPERFAAAIDAAAHPIDCVVASTPIDLMTTLGLARRKLRDVPVVLYAHETQAVYPAGPKGGRAKGALRADWRSLLGADRVLVASRFHRDALVEHLPAATADEQLAACDSAPSVAAGIEVVPIGLNLPSRRPPDSDLPGPVRVLWNHRWAHDKAPERFVHAISVLAGEGHPFELLALGEIERSGRPAFDRLRSVLGDRIRVDGNVDRVQYLAALGIADVVVSTARHEFFGIAAAEAIAAGARPALPDRLSYPELIPPELRTELLWRGDLQDALRPLLSLDRSVLHRHRDDLRGWLDRFSWSRIAPRYDAVVDDLVGAS